MKKLLALLIIIILGILYINVNSGNQYKGWQIISYKLENKNLRLLLADNTDKWARGLMYFKKLDGVDGMIFKFPDKQYRTFWNKNTFIDLNILWLDEDRKVGTSSLSSINKSKEVMTVDSPLPVNNVIELKQ